MDKISIQIIVSVSLTTPTAQSGEMKLMGLMFTIKVSYCINNPGSIGTINGRYLQYDSFLLQLPLFQENASMTKKN